MPVFSERLRDLRRARGLTQKNLAKESGISYGGIKGYELEIRKPASDAIIKLADFFNVSTDYLLGRTDIPYMASK